MVLADDHVQGERWRDVPARHRRPGSTRTELLSRRGRDATSSVIRDLLQLTHRPDILSMAGGLPAPESFPVDRLRAASDAVLSGSGRYGPEAIQYGPTEGVPALRRVGRRAVHGRRPGLRARRGARSPRARSRASTC